MGRLTLVYFIAFTFLKTTAAEFTCDPVQDCLDGQPGDKVPDPENCQNYYYCGANNIASPSSFECGVTSHFSTEADTPDCVLGVACSDNSCASEQACSTDCSSVEFIPFPGDCSQYYRCNDPSSPIGTCPEETPYFDGTICNTDQNKCCSVCDPVCSVEYSVIPDPQDCHQYYLCDEPLTMVSQSCEDGEYFNPVFADCETEESSCSSYCSEK